MKRCLAFLILMLANGCAFAASPSFSSFNQNQFTTNGSVVSLRFLTNNAGTIQASSPVADGASAVGFKVNSANTFANNGANIFEAQNNGTNVYTVNAWGGGFNGRYAESVWGGPSGNYYAYVRADIEGGIDYQWIGVNESNFALQNYLVVRLDSTLAQFDLTGKAVLFPSVGGTLTPYIFDTIPIHTSGNLVEVANNTTNQFTINYLGGVTTGLPTGATNAQPFKIGSEANAIGLVLVATNYIQIELNGVAYKLGLVK
jgi:hypothetical protein